MRTRRQAAKTQKYFEESSSGIYDSDADQKKRTIGGGGGQDGDFKNENDSSFDEDEVLDSISNDNAFGGKKKGMGQSQVVVKTVILAPDCELSDEALMQENETIANPTNKKIKTTEQTPTQPKKETPLAFFMNSDMLLMDPNHFRTHKIEDAIMQQEQPMPLV